MQDKWLRIIGYPVIILISCWMIHRDELLAGGSTVWEALLTSTLFTVVIWEGNRLIFKFFRKKYPGYLGTTRRLVWELLAVIFYSFWAQVVVELILIFATGASLDSALSMDWYTCVIASLLPVIPLGLIYELKYFLAEWKKNIQQTEALARSHVQVQYDTLKKQLDPHFLFNSLNTLAYLIELENEPAQDYLSRLADVYRYVLETRHQATVSLADELRFLDDYLYLNKVRFRENIQVERRLSSASYDRRIPALSLQLLVENAIKHNAISQEQPLLIQIEEDEGGIAVTNNKQARTSLLASTRVGLQNLKEQYRLLTSQPIEIVNAETYFRVHLPFLDLS